MAKKANNKYNNKTQGNLMDTTTPSYGNNTAPSSCNTKATKGMQSKKDSSATDCSR